MSIADSYHPLAPIIREFLRDGLSLDQFELSVRRLVPDDPEYCLADSIIGMVRCVRSDVKEIERRIKDLETDLREIRQRRC